MRQNAVVICVDTFRADMGGAGGDLDFVRTPNVDRLREQGVSFSRCYGEGEPTIPVRRCLFTGRRSFPWRHVVPNTGLRPSEPGWHAIPHEQTTLAERLSDVGYATGLVTDTYHMFKPTMNYTRGFVNWDLIRGQETDPWKGGPADSVDLAAHTIEDDPSPADHAMLLQYLLNMRGRRREEDYLAPRVFSSAADWLEENRDNGPFFLWVDSFSPHELWDPPRYYADAYCPPREGVKDFLHPVAFGMDPSRISAEEVERTRALYFGFVTFVDRWIGYLLDKIEALGLAEETIVTFVTDHGTEVGDKGHFCKSGNRLYPFNTRLNWIIRHPQGPRGATCDAWSQNQDICPTLLSMLGIDHEPLDGFDLWPLCTGAGTPMRDHVLTGWGDNVCVRDDSFAVHLDATRSAAETARVYDLKNDPEEEDDVAADHEQVIATAVERIRAIAGEYPVRFKQYQPDRPATNIRSFVAARHGEPRGPYTA